jgi:hypothetical protein
MSDFDAASADLSYDVRQTWDGGFIADLELTAETAIDGWTLVFDFEGEIVNLWNAEIVSHIGDRYVIQSASYNGTLAPGQSAGFGFQASGAVTHIEPVSINGEPFDGSAPPEPVDPADDGGQDADLFVFSDGDGHDRIVGFDVAADRIDLSGVTNIADYADLVAGHMADNGTDTTITYGDSEDVITLTGVRAEDLDEGNFAF